MAENAQTLPAKAQTNGSQSKRSGLCIFAQSGKRSAVKNKKTQALSILHRMLADWERQYRMPAKVANCPPAVLLLRLFCLLHP